VAATTYVRERRDGVWEVVQEGHRRSHVRAESKAKAVARARSIVRQLGGGEVRVLNRSGKVVAKNGVGKRVRKKASAK
jgi:hypothetical protein